MESFNTHSVRVIDVKYEDCLDNDPKYEIGHSSQWEGHMQLTEVHKRRRESEQEDRDGESGELVEERMQCA